MVISEIKMERKITKKNLRKNNIYQIGRYGRWVFQGLADSIKDGLMIGAAFMRKINKI